MYSTNLGWKLTIYITKQDSTIFHERALSKLYEREDVLTRKICFLVKTSHHMDLMYLPFECVHLCAEIGRFSLKFIFKFGLLVAIWL